MSSLSFFQPAYLWALGFLSVILFLHLFKRRIVRRMDISTLRFLPAAAVSRSRVRKLIELLLLLARLMLVIALILIFAGLHDTQNPLVVLRDPQSTVYIWVDSTMSMEFAEVGSRTGSETMSQRAQNVVDSLTEILSGASPVVVNTLSQSTTILPTTKDSPNNAVSTIKGASPSTIKGASPSTIKGARPFVVISDFQKSTTDILDSILPALIGGGNRVICVSTTPAKPYNYAVRVRGGAAIGGGVTAVVYAHGAALDTAFVELTVGNLRVGQRSVYCGKDDSVAVTFDLGDRGGAGGQGWGRVELSAADPLPFDNRDFFTVSSDSRRSVLIVGSVKRNKVIGAALRAAGPAFWDPVVVKEGGDLSYEDLNDADLVIVNSFGGRSRILESFITGAGADKGIIITLDPDSEADFGRAFLLSNRLVRQNVGVNTIESGTRPVLSDTNTALWRGFPALSSVSARVYRHMTPVPGDALVRMDNGRTLAALGTDDNMLIIATPIGITQANNICETGFFVPFVDRLGRRTLTGRGQADEERYAGYPMRNPFFGTGRTGSLYDTDAKLVASWSNQPFVKVDKPGVYSLVSSSGETSYFSVSSRPDESEMIFTRPNLENDSGIYYFEYDRFLEQVGKLSNNVWSYWLWLILGLILCVETFLWKRNGK